MRRLLLESLVLACLALAAVGCGHVFAGPEPAEGEPAAGESAGPASAEGDYTGSRSCRACHERFYELWAPSHHGTAMQPYTPAFAREFLTPMEEPLEIEGVGWRFVLETGSVEERPGEGEAVSRPVEHVMGGKNVFYFLTPLDRGRLQVLPVAYDVDDKVWYDTTASMVRHAGGHPDDAVHWTDPLLTFNTACWSCHVSQLSVNYDAETNTYDSIWAEPGINCETCHGPAGEHVRVCEEAPEGTTPEDLKIILVSAFDEQQTNDTCAPCHAKAVVLTDSFGPGEGYFDHFDLVCLEDPDFYPDGRDLGENYTFTLWRMSPCVVSGQLDCVHCHTSSGRYRFQGENANDACLPCHEERVKNAPEHTHHPEGTAGNLCISCHMPMTEFARMRRSDHSMRPPAPSLTLQFGSPNACNLCHDDKDAAWADEMAREWRAVDYQAPMLHRAELVKAAREGDWKRLDEMLAEITDDDRDEVVATTLLRLLRRCQSLHKLPAMAAALSDPSPLVRSAAAAGFEGLLSRETVALLFRALSDPVRLVRIRAAGPLAAIPPGRLEPEAKTLMERAMSELETALGVRPDTWSSHYNLGNLYEQRGEHERALASYRKASELRPDVVAPYVNASMIHARTGDLGQAEATLQKALAVAPESSAVHYNLGLLLAEKGKTSSAMRHLRLALKADPSLAGAAYNLALLLEADETEERLKLLGQAERLRPEVARYAWAFGFHLDKAGRTEEAVALLTKALRRGAVSRDVYGLLISLHARRGETRQAQELVGAAAQDRRLSPREREEFARAAGRRPR